MRILCPHAAAMRRARLVCSCHITSEKSGEYLFSLFFSHSGFLVPGGIGVSPVRISTTSAKQLIPMTSISGITEASSVLSIGRNIRFIPSSLASIVAGRAQLIGLTIPSSASSHRNNDVCTISLRNSISFQRMPSAIGRS